MTEQLLILWSTMMDLGTITAEVPQIAWEFISHMGRIFITAYSAFKQAHLSLSRDLHIIACQKRIPAMNRYFKLPGMSIHCYHPVLVYYTCIFM